MKKNRWEKSYWIGIFRDGPHQSLVTTEDGKDLKLPELFVKKSHALKYYEEVCEVVLVPKCVTGTAATERCCDGSCDGACVR